MEFNVNFIIQSRISIGLVQIMICHSDCDRIGQSAAVNPCYSKDVVRVGACPRLFAVIVVLFD